MKAIRTLLLLALAFPRSAAAARDSSGTSWQPEATPHEALHLSADGWTVMLHGQATGIYDKQGGPRGADDWYGANMLMARAERAAGPGTVSLRSMLSLEPATIGRDGYPLLLQTGETADGRTPLVDRQHPHDLFMELAASYSLPLGEGRSAFAYFGLPGEPALGPPNFTHRFSAGDSPEAPITHHWLDSTHVTYGVATVGAIWGILKLEGSAFRGREPDQRRWDIETPKLDSYSGRLSCNPSPAWALQVSWGDIRSREQLSPGVDTHRATASAIYHRSFGAGDWQTTFAWGQNSDSGARRTNAFLLESAVALKRRLTLFGRLERVDKDDLFPPGDPQDGEAFTVNKLSLGAIYDFARWGHSRWGLGGLASVYALPSTLKPAYGDSPFSFMLFARVKLI